MPHVSSAILRAILDECVRLGEEEETLCHLAGLDRNALDDLTSRIDLEDAERLVLLALERTGRPELGLRVGMRAPTQALHVVGHLLMNAPSLRVCLDIFDRYAALIIDGLKLEVSVEGRVATARFTCPDVDPRHAAFMSDCVFTFILQLATALLGSHLGPIEVRMRRPTPADPSLYQRLARGPVRFGCGRDECDFDAALLERRGIGGDETVSTILERRADSLMAQLDADAPIEGRVRDLLRGAPHLLDLSADEIAASLGLGSRTLQRRLRERGLSLSALVEDERRGRAIRAVACSEMPIKEIAYLTGFSEPSAFHRAFKRWTGKTPVRYREESAQLA